MTHSAIKLVFISNLFFLGLSSLAYSQSALTYITNFDVMLKTETNSDMRINTNAVKVHSGDIIPHIEFNNYKVELKISESSENKYSLEAVIFTKSDGEWTPVVLDIPDQEGDLGVPLKLDWGNKGYSLDLAIVVNKSPS